MTTMDGQGQTETGRQGERGCGVRGCVQESRLPYYPGILFHHIAGGGIESREVA